MFKFNSISPMLQTADISKTIEFYTNLLRFTLDSFWPEENPEWCSLSQNEVNIMFYKDDQDPNPILSMSGHLYLKTNNVLELYESLKGKVEVLWGPEVYHYGMREFAIRDCNGYTLAFGEPTEDPPTCEN